MARGKLHTFQFFHQNPRLVSSHAVKCEGLKNPFIQHAYRWNYTKQEALASLLQLHNDTWNIWTHLVAFLYFVYELSILTQNMPIESTFMDKFVMSTYILSAQTCFLLSAAYHLFRCIDSNVYAIWYSLDITGICVLIAGSYVVGVYNAFYCWRTVGHCYIFILMCFLCIALFFGNHPRFYSITYDTIRTAALAAPVAFGILPAIHWVGLCMQSTFQCPSQVLWSPLYMFLCYGIGFVFFALKIPERWAPGYFDIHLSSHQLWHIMVFTAAYVWKNAALDYFLWRLNSPNAICTA